MITNKTLVYGCQIKRTTIEQTVAGSAFLEATQQRTMPLAVFDMDDTARSWPNVWADEGIIGLVVADNWNESLIWQVVGFPVEPGNSPTPMEIIQNRVLSGFPQAMTDWEFLRLAAAMSGIELGSGSLYLVYESEPDNNDDDDDDAETRYCDACGQELEGDLSDYCDGCTELRSDNDDDESDDDDGDYDEDTQYCDRCGQELEGGRIGYCDACIELRGGARSEYDEPEAMTRYCAICNGPFGEDVAQFCYDCDELPIPDAIEALDTLIAQEGERLNDDYSGIYADEPAAIDARRGLRALHLAREILNNQLNNEERN